MRKVGERKTVKAVYDDLRAVSDLSARFFQGLSDPTRVRIIYYLLEGDKSVGELVSLLGSPQGRVSSHLACLRWCGFVTSYREGKNVYYRVMDARVREILGLARDILAENAEQVLACSMMGRGRPSPA